MSTLAHGRQAYAERRWPDAVGQYTAAGHDEPCPCEGLLSVPVGLDALYKGDAGAAANAFARAAEIGRRCPGLPPRAGRWSAPSSRT